jgi:ligand-binding SRPBCC domain-containing protein
MLQHARFEHWIAAPLDQVFRFFANPQNLPRLMPPWMQVKLESVQIIPPSDLPASNFAGPGSALAASYRVLPFLPFRTSSVARITAFALNHYFEDVQEKGPFKTWHHRHEFAREVRNGVDGTLVIDQVEYDPGLGILGTMGNALFVAPQMRKTFHHRQMALDQIVHSGKLTPSG